MNRLVRGLLGCVIILATLSGGCDEVEYQTMTRLDLRPNQRQSEARVQEIAALDVQRTGVLEAVAVALGAEASSATARIRYSLSSPQSPVEDTDIRGYRDGSVKYGYNQGTSYHMRVGRRYGGPHDGQFELKRTLIQWTLPELPQDARIVSAEVTLWVEAFMIDSPLADETPLRPLHLYLYPVDVEWEAGAGGVEKDDLSRAAPGEASWTHARAEEEPWPAPGALEPDTATPGQRYASAPVGMGLITQDDTALSIGGDRLVAHIREIRSSAAPLSLLLKLEDEEEDRWGTELAFLSSNFGDEKDVVSKRPRLSLVVEVPGNVYGLEHPFVVEPGMDQHTSVLRHPEGSVLLAAALRKDEGVPPAIWVRGGDAQVDPEDAEWQEYSNPFVTDWAWSQFRISSPGHRVAWDTPFRVEVLETWVKPGPREKQVPELVLVSPSGSIYRVDGYPVPELSYRIDFRPRELGLWRYGWSFRPTYIRPLGGHQGEGTFYVTIPEGEAQVEKLEALAEHVIEMVRRRGGMDPEVQRAVNGFVRLAASFGHAGAAERESGERLIARVREAVEQARD